MAADNVQYWPMAMTADGQALFTYDSVSTIQEVQKCLETWSESHELAEAWAAIHKEGKSLGKITFRRVWCVTTDLYEGKSLRDIIKELHPNSAGSDYVAGVMGCPSDYRTPVDLSPYDRCTEPNLFEMPKCCEECWNQIYSTKEGIPR